MIPPELHCLAQLLPVPKTIAELSAWDAFTTTSPQKSVKTTQTAVANISTVQGRSGRVPVTVRKILQWHGHHATVSNLKRYQIHLLIDEWLQRW